MINDDLYEDEVMRDVWERKAAVSAMYAAWEKNPELREKYKKWMESEGWKIASFEEWAEKHNIN